MGRKTRGEMMDDLEGKTALVTGASRGIGRAVAIALGRAGAAVAINFRRERAEAEKAAGEIGSAGGRAIVVQADAGVAAEVEGMVREVHERLGPVQILVNNAGIARPQPIEQITGQD